MSYLFIYFHIYIFLYSLPIFSYRSLSIPFLIVRNAKVGRPVRGGRRSKVPNKAQCCPTGEATAARSGSAAPHDRRPLLSTGLVTPTPGRARTREDVHARKAQQESLLI